MEGALRTRAGALLPLGLTIRLYGSTDKWRHGYVPGYECHLRSRRWRHQRLLEIGVGGYESTTPGGSLRVWRDYLPRSTVVGLDIHLKDVRLGTRVRVVQGDQSDTRDLARAIAALGGPPSIVIDDGSHHAGHAIASFEYLFPRMPPGSLYVIEDLHTSYWADYGGGIPVPSDTAVAFSQRLVESVQAADRTFAWLPELPAPNRDIDGVAVLDVRPGIVFIEKM